MTGVHVLVASRFIESRLGSDRGGGERANQQRLRVAPAAKIWQTPGDGEQFMRQLDAHSFAEMLQSLGVRADAAKATAERVDDRMKDCILKLYRSAVHVGDEWQAGL
jgi:hypothetical protein